MRKAYSVAVVAVAIASLLSAARPQAAELSDYTVEQLLEPCMEGDNDSRWGQVAEQECEQYIRGFTDAYLMTVAGGAEGVSCLPPEGNRDDEIRWAFMKWTHKNLDMRDHPAAQGLLAMLREVFGCK